MRALPKGAPKRQGRPFFSFQRAPRLSLFLTSKNWQPWRSAWRPWRILRVTLLVIALVGPALASLRTGDARASVAYESPYTFEQTYGTALRLIRVDLGLKITEKDQDLGYVLFEYTSPESGKRVSSGSVEVVRGKEGVHVAVQLPTMPAYHEQVIVDALAKKLIAEHGDPPKRPKPAPPVADAGADGEPPAG